MVEKGYPAGMNLYSLKKKNIKITLICVVSNMVQISNENPIQIHIKLQVNMKLMNAL